MATSKGHRQKKHSKHGKAHKVDYGKIYPYWIPSVELGTLQFRTFLLQSKEPRRNIDGMIDSIELRDEPGSAVMTGSLNLKRPDPSLVNQQIYDGDRIRTEVLWFGHWIEYVTIRLRNGSEQLSGAWTFELADDGTFLQEWEDEWHFVKSKKHGRPNGWKAHEIAREVFRRLGIQGGQVAEGKHWITDLSGKMTAMQVLQKAYAIERRASGHRFVIRWHNGRPHILPMKRNPYMNVFGPLIEDALVGRKDRDASFATAVTLRATIKSGKGKHKKADKVVVKLSNPAAVKKEGMVHKVLDGGDVKTPADAQRKVRRYLNHHSIRKRTISGITHPLVPFVRRGDACRISLPRWGFYGNHGVAFVASMTATLSGGSAEMSIDVVTDDPYLAAIKEAKDAALRAKKAKERKHTKMHTRKKT